MEADIMFAECEIIGAAAPAAVPGRPRVFDMDPTAMVAMVRVPPPRRLPADMDGRHVAEALAQCYKAAMRRRVGDCWLRLAGDPATWKQYPGLLRCGDALREAKIPPAAWCLFWFDRHKAGKLPGNPKLMQCWSAKAVANRADWYERQRGKYEGAREVMAPKHAALARDWRAMVALASVCKAGAEQAAKKVFPGDSFARRLDEAVADQRRCQRIVDEAAASAGMHWGW